MTTSHIRSITVNVIKFIKTKLSFLASKFRLLFSKPQASTINVDESTLNESQDERRQLNAGSNAATD